MTEQTEETGEETKAPTEAPITKRQVVREELEVAVQMAFTAGSSDAVILVLASAAWEILQALAARTKVNTVKQMLGSKVADKDRKKFLGYLNEPYNFMKHATSDPDKALDMEAAGLKEWSRFVLYAACHDYGALFGEFTPEMLVYRMIWRVDNPLAMEPPTTRMQMHAANILLQMGNRRPSNLIGMLRANPDILEKFKKSDAPL